MSIAVASTSRLFQEAGYSVHDVPHDGQCAYSSISHQLSVKKLVPENITSDDVRHDLVNYLDRNDELKETISERLVGQTINEYISDMKQKQTWADENMLYVASVFYNITIHIIQPGKSTPTIIGPSSATSGDRLIEIGYVSSVPGEPPTHYVSLLSHKGY